MEEIIQWPLVLFSLLAGAGGCAFAFAGASEFVGGTKRARFAVGIVSLVLVVVGGLFSVLHLASPQHVMAAVRHVFSFSGVSVELMVLGLLVVVGVVYLVLSKRSGVDGARKGFAVAGIVLGLLLAFVTGHGYVISAKAAWFTVSCPSRTWAPRLPPAPCCSCWSAWPPTRSFPRSRGACPWSRRPSLAR